MTTHKQALYTPALPVHLPDFGWDTVQPMVQKYAQPKYMLFALSTAFFVAAAGVFFLTMPSRMVEAQTPPVTAPAAVAQILGTLEVHIANNGLVLLRSASVIKIEGKTLTLSTAWGRTNILWTVRTDASDFEGHHYGTKILDRTGKTGVFDDIHVGGQVTITGMLDQNAADPTITAATVRVLQ